MSIKDRIAEDMKTALRAGDKSRLSALRLMLAGIKQLEVDSGKAAGDDAALALLAKMSKQRRESIEQFKAARRDDLVAQESLELAVIQSYMPEPLSAEEIEKLVHRAMLETGAKGMSDMGKVMAFLKPALHGRADMGDVGARIKARLASG